MFRKGVSAKFHISLLTLITNSNHFDLLIYGEGDMNNADQQTEQADLKKLKRAQDLMSLNDLIGAKSLLEAIAANVPDKYQTIEEDETRIIFRCWDEDEFEAFLTYCITVGEKREVVSQQSVYPKALYLLANVAVEEGQSEKALDLLNKVIALEPNQPRCFAEIAFIASMNKDFEASFALYQKAMNVRPYCGEFLKALILRGLGTQSIELGNLGDAENYLNESLIIDPGNESALHELAYIAHLKKGGPKTEVVYHKESIVPAQYFPVCFRCGKCLVVNVDHYRVLQQEGSTLCICSACEEKDRYIESLRNEAKSCFQKGDFEKSLNLQDEILKANPNDAWAHCNKGVCYSELGRHEEAIPEYDQAINIVPTFIKAYINRGISLFETECPENAINDFTKAAELSDGSDASCFNWRGRCFSELGNHEQAIIDYSEAIRLNPDSIKGYFNRANAYNELGDSDAALRDINDVLKISPNFAEAYFHRSRIYDSLGETKLAYADVDRAISIDPAITKYHYVKGIICFSLERYQDAVSSFSKALQFTDDSFQLSDLLQKRALCHLALRKMDAAAEDFEKSLSEGGDAVECNYYLGYLYVETGDFVRALSHLDESLRLQPDHIESHFSRGVALKQMERHLEAIDDMTYVISREPDHVLAYINRGDALSSIKRYHEAIADFNKAIDIAPEMVDAYCERAFALNEVGEAERAFSDLEVAMSLDDKNSKPFLAKAILLLDCDKPEEALDYIAAAEEREPGNKGIAMVRTEAYKLLEEIKGNS